MATTYLLDIVILPAAAVIAVPIFRAIGLGAVPGFLVAGILVGPSGLSLIDNVTEISRLSELGIVLLLFVIGIELKPARLWLMRRLVFGLGTVQVVVTGALITMANCDATLPARGHDASQCRKLQQLGARIAVAENLEASLELASEALILEFGDTDQTAALLRRFRRDYYAGINADSAQEPPDRTSR